MKKSVKPVILCLLAAAMCACSARTADTTVTMQTELSVTETDSGAAANRAALLYSATDGETAYTPEPFSSYSFD